MSAAALPNLSSDLIWEVVRSNNAFFAKSKKNGGVQFSRDPLNLTNKASRKNAGFVNEKAVGVTYGENGEVIIISKKADTANKPAKNLVKTTLNANKTNRKTYQAVANQVAVNGYRADLREAAVQRASALKSSNKPVKADHEHKLRGSKAKKAAAAAAAEEN